MAWRSSSRSIRSPPSEAAWASASRTPCSTASRSAARKKKRSNTSSSTRRSSWLLASVADSASRNWVRSVQLTASSARKPSSSSEVPTAMPSLRSSSANSSRRGAMPGGPEGSPVPP